MSTPSSPNSWTRTVIKLRKSNEVRHLFRSAEGKLIFDQPLVGKLFNIVNDRLDVNNAKPDPSALESARALVQVQLGPDLYMVSYLCADGTPQMPEAFRPDFHALQKPNGEWCFLPRSQATIPEDWSPAILHNQAQMPPTKTTTAQPEKPEEPREPGKKEEPKKAKESPQAAAPNAGSGNGACTEASQSEASQDSHDNHANSNSRDHGNFGGENYPITNLSNYPMEPPKTPIPEDTTPPKNAVKLPPSDVLDFLESTIAEYLVCSPAQRSVLALWILHTYTFEAAHFTPYLNIYSPLEESGKSTCMAVLRTFCARPWWAAGSSPATFKRRVSDGYLTVLLDNWQTVFRGSDKNQFTGFLLNGCNQAHDVATVDASQQSRADLWQTFCPKAFAGMESLPPSLARQSIPIFLQRRKPLELVKSTFNLLIPGSAHRLTSWMQRWAEEHEPHVATTFDGYELQGPILPSLSPHQQNCARVLLAVAETIGGHWPQKASAALYEVFRQEQARSSSALQLLSDIRDAFVRRGNPQRIFTAEILEDLHDRDDRSWYEYGKSGKPLTSHALSRILGPCFKIYSRSQRRGEQKLRGYQLSDFQEAWERYLPPLDEDQSVTTVKDNPTASTKSTKSTSSTATIIPHAQSKPRKTSLVSMSHSKAPTENAKAKTASRLKNFAAKTLRIFTAVWS